MAPPDDTTGRTDHAPMREAVIEHRRVRERRGREGGRLSLNLTAMIDVTFLLLVYFMVATEFRLGEEVYRLDLPQRLQAQQERDPFDLDDEPLQIQVSSTTVGTTGYRLRLDGAFAATPATFNELIRFLEDRRSEAERGIGGLRPDHPIVIQPSSAARWEHAIEAFNAALRAGYSNINFAKPGP